MTPLLFQTNFIVYYRRERYYFWNVKTNSVSWHPPGEGTHQYNICTQIILHTTALEQPDNSSVSQPPKIYKQQVI